jgi:gamma-glutamylcyclotransferase (GGCT)/AIG2-like uncharacterized protein YtfP
MATATYFAFGSNLDERQMRARCPGAALLGPATLPRHALVFAGYSGRWRGGVASVVRDPRRSVPGVLYRLGRDDLARLDRFEGHPVIYERVTRYVIDHEGRRRRVQVYVLRRAVAPRLPSLEYARVMARAYDRLGLDPRALLRALTMEAA